jgi:hypothetical protein
MIKFILQCKNKHEFESWFSNSIEYERLKKKNLIECIFCKSKIVDKSIMSPNIVCKKQKKNNLFDDKEFINIKKDLQKMKKFIKKNFDFVGDRFPQEVRKIYYDNKKKNNIYGTVSSTEREELEAEGIELSSIPWTGSEEN